MTHRLEAVDRLAANALARRVGRAQLRVRGLEIEQLTVKLIVLAVADRRLCLDIISPVMPTNLIGQFIMPLSRRISHQSDVPSNTSADGHNGL